MMRFTPIDMAQFAAIEVATAGFAPFTDKHVASTRKALAALKHIERHDGSHDYGYCWGCTIFRTVYGTGFDEKVAQALTRLATYAEHFATRPGQQPDASPNKELWSRYYCDLMQDEQALSQLTEDEIGEQFDAWILQNRRPVRGRREHNSRFMFCVMLDRESVDNIIALPEDPHVPIPYKAGEEDEGVPYLKLISDRLKTEDEEGQGRYWLRVGITEFLWPVYFFPQDPDILIEQLGWVDSRDEVQNLWGSPTLWFNKSIEGRFVLFPCE